MQMRFFQIPAFDADDANEELNKFLGAHRVVTVDRHFVADGINSSWAIAVTYVEGAALGNGKKRSKVDYREVLSGADFQVFAKLRELRKRQAAEDGCPIYAVFTNQQLAEIAEKRPESLDQLAAIDGVGLSRIEKHGEQVLALLNEITPGVPPDPGLNGQLHGA